MDSLIFAAGQTHKLLHIVILAAAISLVYASTRHEDMKQIFQHAAKIGAWMLGILFTGIIVLTLLSLKTI
jgi:multisubunit Na+/H+ antiporter MnhB subunit